MEEKDIPKEALAVLGLDELADPQALEAARENLTAAWDPEGFGDALPQIKARAVFRLAEIRRAYDRARPYIHSPLAAHCRHKARKFQQATANAKARADAAARGLAAVGLARKIAGEKEKQKQTQEIRAMSEFSGRAYETGKQMQKTAALLEKKRRTEEKARRLAQKATPMAVGRLFWLLTALAFIWLIFVDAWHFGVSGVSIAGLIFFGSIFAWSFHATFLVMGRAKMTGAQKSAVRFYLLFFMVIFLAAAVLTPTAFMVDSLQKIRELPVHIQTRLQGTPDKPSE